MQTARFSALLGLVACGGAVAPREAAKATALPTLRQGQEPKANAGTRSFEVTLRALEEGNRRVLVSILATGENLTTWHPPVGTFSRSPDVPSGVTRDGSQWRVTDADGHVELGYTVDLGPSSEHPFVRLDQVVAIPESFVGRAIDVRLRHDGGHVAPVFVTNAGLGEVDLETTGARLGTFFLAYGAGGTAHFRASEGEDTIAWLGYPAFDARAVGAEMAGFRTRLYERFHESPVPRETVLLSVELEEKISPIVRPEGAWDVSRKPFSIVARVSGKTPYDRPLRVALAEALVERFIGERMFVGDPQHPEKTDWFQRGVRHGVTLRELALAGLLTTDEYATELSSLMTTATFESDSPLTPLARGALYFHELTTKLGGTDAFFSLLSRLYAAAEGHPVPEDVWHRAVTKQLGDDGAKLFDRFVVRGEVNLSPFGCIRTAPTSLSIARFGFDLASTLSAGHFVGLSEEARKAGLSDEQRLTLFALKGSAAEVSFQSSGAAGPTAGSVALPIHSEKRRGFRVFAAPRADEEKCRSHLR